MKKSLLALVLLLAILGSCSRPGKLEVGDDLLGTRIVVWDILEPEFVGAPNYKEGVARTVSRFQEETGVMVHLTYVERKDIAALLLGNLPEDTQKPDLVSSSEWPMVPGDPIILRDNPETSMYIQAAQRYWSGEDGLFAIPAYIHWFGEAAKEEGGAASRSTGYWVQSPAFLQSVFGEHGTPLTQESILEYALWVRGTYGGMEEDVLRTWDQGDVDSLVPVTPHLHRWLTDTADSKVSLGPTRSPFGDASFFYTVPGYQVLAQNGRGRLAAAELGARLARHLGLWAARVLGCVPALSSDGVIFHLEAPLDLGIKDALWEAAIGGSIRAPSAERYLADSELHGALTGPLERYLGGEGDQEALEEGIRSLLPGHARP